MAWALLSPPLNLPTSSSSTTHPTINTAATAATNGRGYWRRKRATSLVIAKASEKGDAKSKDTTPEFNPFGFVTDNPSSRSAIQLPESPAEDGNVGQMLYVSHFAIQLFLTYVLLQLVFVLLEFRLSTVRFYTELSIVSFETRMVFDIITVVRFLDF